jgi:UDP-N-acetylglucosamine 2-epimerase (non-hydrolysing)
MKIMIVVGTRPNFMKAAPIVAAIRQHNENALQPSLAEAGIVPQLIRHTLVHTGQHYSESMSSAFFDDLNLPAPDVHLNVGSGSHAVQTAEIMKQFEAVLLRELPDVVVVVGDVNSTVACALVAAKISFDSKGSRPIIAHVEAGLRSFDRSMPEEINRVITDHISDLLFVTEQSGLRNLAREGVPAEKVHFVGNTMIDSLLASKERAEASTILENLGLRYIRANNGSGSDVTPYALLTLHRPSNVDDRDALLNILESLEDLIKTYIVVFPAHPRTQKRIEEFRLEDHFEWKYARHETGGPETASGPGAIRLTEPLGYLDFLCLMTNAALIATDSGGIQEETTCLGVPCVTIRENTERPVTIERGTNVLAGVTKVGIRAAIARQLHSRKTIAIPELWDGNASVRILDVISRECSKSKLISDGFVEMAHSAKSVATAT